MTRRVRRALGLALAAACGAWTATAGAAVPSAPKIAEAVASENRDAGRAGPLLLEVTLRIGNTEAAEGVLASHPTGLARLELRSPRGFVERHLLQGSDYTASRDGRLLERPHPFLPPLFLLQTESGAALAAALSSFGVAVETAVLGRVEEHDCYVLGGRAPPGGGSDGRRLPSLWVDLESYEVVRLDRADGVRFRLGPTESFDGVRVPRWIAIEAPDEPPMRLEIRRVAPASAPAAAFGTDWLSAPHAP